MYDRHPYIITGADRSQRVMLNETQALMLPSTLLDTVRDILLETERC